MFKKCFIVLLLATFITGCVNIQTDNRIRIKGIITACKNNPDEMDNYLKQKLENNQVSDLTVFVIQECLNEK